MKKFGPKVRNTTDRQALRLDQCVKEHERNVGVKQTEAEMWASVKGKGTKSFCYDKKRVFIKRLRRR